jgi:hypothetical protein
MTLSISFVGAALFAFSVRQDVHLHVLIPVSLALTYPLAVALLDISDSRTVHLGYALVVAAAFGSVLAAANSVPTGYGDVWYYVRTTELLVDSGFLSFPTDQSGIMVGLFVLTTLLMELTNQGVFYTAKLLPVVTFLFTIVIYYAIVTRYLDRQYRLFGLIFFFMNWGLFRFSIEFRTLNVALPILLSVVLLLVKTNDGERIATGAIALLSLLIFGLTLSDFSVHFFFYALVLSFLMAWVVIGFVRSGFDDSARVKLYGSKTDTAVFVLGLSVVSVFVYTEFVVNRTPTIVGFGPYLWERFLTLFIYDGSLVSESKSQGLQGRTFGDTVFVMRWLLRGIFAVTGVAYLYHVYRDRLVGPSWIFASGLSLGSLLVFGTVVGLPISPSRIFLFVAIPYGIVFGGGLFYIREHTHFPIHNVVKGIVVLVLILAVVTTMVRFPQAIVGDTDPIRGEEPIDSVQYYFVGAQETSTDAFISRYSVDGVETPSTAIQKIFLPVASDSARLGICYPDTVDNLCGRDHGAIYSTGKLSIVTH